VLELLGAASAGPGQGYVTRGVNTSVFAMVEDNPPEWRPPGNQAPAATLPSHQPD
jgi:hypothetical protein